MKIFMESGVVILARVKLEQNQCQLLDLKLELLIMLTAHKVIQIEVIKKNCFFIHFHLNSKQFIMAVIAIALKSLDLGRLIHLIFLPQN